MGSCFSDRVQPENGNKFEQFSDGVQQNPVNKSRSCTDVFFLLVMITFVIGLLGLLIYCSANGDIFRVINGYDSCGNVCGEQNYKIYDPDGKFECHGGDLKDKPYLFLSNTTAGSQRKQCVADCSAVPGYRTFLNRCVPEKGQQTVNQVFTSTGLKNFFQEASEDLHLCWREIIYLCLIALAFSIILMLLFRFFVGIVVWVVLIGVALACIAGTVFLWSLYVYSKKNLDANSDIDSSKTTSYLIFAIIATIVATIIILLILIMRKRIQLVVQLFTEAGKAIAAMPLLLLEPLLTFISLVFVVSLWVYFCIVIQSAGALTSRSVGDLFYQKDIAMKLTRWFNLLGMLWMAQFVIGCQHVLIAGAVAKWYFRGKDEKLGLPIYESTCNLVKYHLGSVALGSFIISLVQFIRILLKTLQSYLKGRAGKCAEYTLTCCQCCLGCFERILKYLTKNAYIEIAITGKSFCKSGQQAFKLLVSNALRVAVINSVGDFVLFLGKVLVVAATVLIGIEILEYKQGLQHIWIPIMVAGLFAYFISNCFVTVYETAIDTIFLCVCEDFERNDGVSRPYYMSTDLNKFLLSSKQALDQEKGKDQAWQDRPSTISDKVDG